MRSLDGIYRVAKNVADVLAKEVIIRRENMNRGSRFFRGLSMALLTMGLSLVFFALYYANKISLYAGSDEVMPSWIKEGGILIFPFMILVLMTNGLWFLCCAYLLWTIGTDSINGLRSSDERADRV